MSSISSSANRSLKLQTIDLLQVYQTSKEPKVRNQILQLNLGLVRREVNIWMNRCQESPDDLLQIGSLGLIRAIERYDLERGYAFSSFAMPYIRGEIQHYLRDKGATVRIPRRWLELHQKAQRFTRDFREAENRQPTQTEIADALDVSLKEWREIQVAYQNRSPLSLDITIQDDDSNTSLGDLIADPKYRNFQLAREDRVRLQQALAQLEERTRHVLEFVFLHDLTQKETANRLGISVVTVSRQLKRGLGRLRQIMQSDEE